MVAPSAQPQLIVALPFTANLSLINEISPTESAFLRLPLTDVAAFGYSDEKLAEEVNHLRNGWSKHHGTLLQLLEASSTASTTFLEQDQRSSDPLHILLHQARRAEFNEWVSRLFTRVCWVQIYGALESGLDEFLYR